MPLSFRSEAEVQYSVTSIELKDSDKYMAFVFQFSTIHIINIPLDLRKVQKYVNM